MYFYMRSASTFLYEAIKLILVFFSLAKSRQNERTLIHALKNPKSFVVAPNNPMFPKEPVAVEQSMVFSQGFHMSQLHGVRKRQKKPDKQSWSTRNWKLSETEEFQRSCVLGRLPNVRLVATQEAIFSTNVRRRFLVGRVWSCSQTTKSKSSLVSHGRLSELLRTIETSYSIKRNKIKTGSFRKSAEAVLDIVFPLSNAHSVTTVVESFINSKNESVSMASTDTSDIHVKKASDSNIPNVTITKIHHPLLGVNIASDSTEISPKPVQRSFGHLTNKDKFGKMISSEPDGLPLIEYPTPSMKSKPFEPILNVDEFRLPSQSDSSSYESDADLRVDNAPVVGNDVTADDAFCLPTPSSDEENDGIDSDHGGNDIAIEKSTNVEIPIDDVFCLPTPESSSDEEQSIDDDLNRCSRNTILLENENSLDSPIVHEVNRMKSVGSLPVGTSEPAILQSNAQVAKFSPSTKRSGGRVRFSLESSVGQDVLSNLESSQDFVPGNRKNQNKRILAIEDTPESVAVTRSAVETKLDSELHDTQEVNDLDHCICAICLTNDLQEDNPIILCDGSSLGVQCNLMVHIQCYSINFNWKDDKEWRCDQCEYLFGGGSSTNLKCLLCDRRNGILKLSTDGLWKHIKCDMVLTTQRDSLIRLRRLPRTESQKYPHAVSRRRPLADISPKNQESPTILALQKKRRRLLVMQQFMDYEADASDIDDDDEQEELEIRAIEEEEDELARDFINDSSQLGFAYDDLDRVDPVHRLEDIATSSHRALDMERERKLEFATPVLSRRIRQRQLLMNSSDNTEDDDRSDTVQATGCTAPDSSRGLGNMHFIRSVLDHHRNGGSAEEIEELYNELEKQANDENEADENTTVAFSNKW
jgi:PHD-finger